MNRHVAFKTGRSPRWWLNQKSMTTPDPRSPRGNGFTEIRFQPYQGPGDLYPQRDRMLYLPMSTGRNGRESRARAHRGNGHTTAARAPPRRPRASAPPSRAPARPSPPSGVGSGISEVGSLLGPAALEMSTQTRDSQHHRVRLCGPRRGRPS